MDSTEGGIVVTYWAESSLLLEVKEKQDQYSILLDLKASVSITKEYWFLNKGEMVC